MAETGDYHHDVTELRDDILLAAAQQVCDDGLRSLTVASVASAAGVSRPTVYKHVGDADTIITALITSQVDRFFCALEPVLATDDPIIDRLVDAVRFTAAYARDNDLVQALLHRESATSLPLFTIHGQPLIRRGMDALLPHLTRAQQHGEISVDDLDVAAEWGVRLAITLILTPALSDGLAEEAHLRGLAAQLLSSSGVRPAGSL